eukprot:CAMPEP_0172327934 /NCGR_PEP_ID=MMETSP1058-20130122/60085_1 /TAXON_ID=83371 /ORGANISM="Detonula confervacea, Strain CCMP 353" /LENGTH=522 /DNA_ID=CAMNT_0013045023 /DNA_START=1563 /DNA_END=3127 /DNA_ORIENTATION=+
MEDGYAEFPKIAPGGGDAGFRGEEEDGVGYKLTVPAGTLLQQYFHQVFDELLPTVIPTKRNNKPSAKFGHQVRGGQQKASTTLLARSQHTATNPPLPSIPPPDHPATNPKKPTKPTAVPTKRKKKPRAKFGRRVRGGQQKASTTFLAWRQHTVTNPPLPAIPPGAAPADNPATNPKKGKTKQQLIGQLGHETMLRLNAEAREEKERREKEKHATTKKKHIQKNRDICAVLREAQSKLRNTERQLSNTTTKLQLKDKELLENNNMWNEEMQAAVDIRLAERDGENTRATEKKVKRDINLALYDNNRMHKNNAKNASSVILGKHADEKTAIQSAHAKEMKNLSAKKKDLSAKKKEVKRMKAETKKLKRKLATQDRREKMKLKVLLGEKDRTHSKEMKQMKEDMQVAERTSTKYKEEADAALSLLAKERQQRKEFVDKLSIEYKANLKKRQLQHSQALLKKAAKLKELQSLVNEMVTLRNEMATKDKSKNKSVRIAARSKEAAQHLATITMMNVQALDYFTSCVL